MLSAKGNQIERDDGSTRPSGMFFVLVKDEVWRRLIHI
jgi:hypothetical protein